LLNGELQSLKYEVNVFGLLWQFEEIMAAGSNMCSYTLQESAGQFFEGGAAILNLNV
jgi:hypothetical protein